MINYDEKIFGKVDNYIIPQQGDLLISSPLMTESTFRHTVILLAEVDADNSGACTGFVMNRCSNTELSDVIDFENVPSGVRVYIGGPVSNDHLFFIHGYGSIFMDMGLWSVRHNRFPKGYIGAGVWMIYSKLSTTTLTANNFIVFLSDIQGGPIRNSIRSCLMTFGLSSDILYWIRCFPYPKRHIGILM